MYMCVCMDSILCYARQSCQILSYLPVLPRLHYKDEHDAGAYIQIVISW
jgi:hypothetical protein